ncbi:hypothetical protein ON010_g14790 [Phytophthora cinnamomi]|nr:hypothetical protein ON010_g14790 [Phytophthora cinnamomi]
MSKNIEMQFTTGGTCGVETVVEGGFGIQDIVCSTRHAATSEEATKARRKSEIDADGGMPLHEDEGVRFHTTIARGNAMNTGVLHEAALLAINRYRRKAARGGRADRDEIEAVLTVEFVLAGGCENYRERSFVVRCWVDYCGLGLQVGAARAWVDGVDGHLNGREHESHDVRDEDPDILDHDGVHDPHGTVRLRTDPLPPPSNRGEEGAQSARYVATTSTWHAATVLTRATAIAERGASRWYITVGNGAWVVDHGGLIRLRRRVDSVEDQLDRREHAAEGVGEQHPEVHGDDGVDDPAHAVEEVGQTQREGHRGRRLVADDSPDRGERGLRLPRDACNADSAIQTHQHYDRESCGADPVHNALVVREAVEDGNEAAAGDEPHDGRDEEREDVLGQVSVPDQHDAVGEEHHDGQDLHLARALGSVHAPEVWPRRHPHEHGRNDRQHLERGL